MKHLLFLSVLFCLLTASADPQPRWNKIHVPFDQKDSFMFGSCEPEIAMLESVESTRLAERYDDQMVFSVQIANKEESAIYSCFDCNRVYNRFVVSTEVDKVKACEASELE